MGAMDYSAFPKYSLKDFIDKYIYTIEKSFKQINVMMGGDENEEVSFNFFFIMFEAMKRFPEMLEIEAEQYRNDMKVWERVIENARKSKEIVSHTTNTEIANLFLYCTDGVFIRALNSNKQVKYSTKLQEAFYSLYENLMT